MSEEQKTPIVQKNKGGRPRKDSIDKSSFLRRDPHETEKVLRKLQGAALKAVDVLVKVMEDKNADPKTKESAASNVLRHLSTMAEQKNKDEIARKVAEIRIRGVSGNLSTVDDSTASLEFALDEEYANQEPLEVEYTETDEDEEGA